MKDIGFDLAHVKGDFKWWKNYLSLCRSKNVLPASVCWKKNAKWPFVNLLPLLFSLKISRNEITQNSPNINIPFFNTAAGIDFLEVIKDINFTEDDLFGTNISGMGMYVGSWISRQNKCRPDMNIDDLKIIPYNMGNRKVAIFDTCNLQTHLHPDINKNETDRIWNFLKTILSRSFQKEFCGLTGAISVRKDISPQEHEWFSEEYSKFFPSGNDYVFHSSIFNRELRAYFSAIMENFIFYNGNPSEVLERLDIKL
jgi:hypothetical protein